MSSMLDKVLKAEQSKLSIKQALIDKGVDMNNVPFESYGTKVSEISVGGETDFDSFAKRLYKEHVLNKGYTEEVCVISFELMMHRTFTHDNTSSEVSEVNVTRRITCNGDMLSGDYINYNSETLIDNYTSLGGADYVWYIDFLSMEEFCNGWDNSSAVAISIFPLTSGKIFPSIPVCFNASNTSIICLNGMMYPTSDGDLSKVFKGNKVVQLYGIPSMPKINVSSMSRLKTLGFEEDATFTEYVSCDYFLSRPSVLGLIDRLSGNSGTFYFSGLWDEPYNDITKVEAKGWTAEG